MSGVWARSSEVQGYSLGNYYLDVWSEEGELQHTNLGREEWKLPYIAQELNPALTCMLQFNSIGCHRDKMKINIFLFATYG